MDLTHFILYYLVVLNVLKATQDGLDSVPANATILQKIIAIMQANVKNLYGDRIQPIQGGAK